MKAEKKSNKEKILNVKVNKKALEKFMARLFWITLILITFTAFILFITSLSDLYNVWQVVEESLYQAWALIRTPLITSMICVAWIGMFILFIRLVREK